MYINKCYILKKNNILTEATKTCSETELIFLVKSTAANSDLFKLVILMIFVAIDCVKRLF